MSYLSAPLPALSTVVSNWYVWPGCSDRIVSGTLASRLYSWMMLVRRTTESLTRGAPSKCALTVTESPRPAVALYGAHMIAETVYGVSIIDQ